MPTLTVRTVPVKGYARIYRVSNRYGILNEGEAPVSALRTYPFDYLVEFEPVIDRNCNLWMPELYQERGICQVDSSRTYRYFNMGPAW